jgi:DNA-binding XRE family transcriptional regulator
MIAHTKHTVIYENERPAFVVVPYADYQQLFEHDSDVLIPHDVVKLQTQYQCNLLGAWRRFRGLTQQAFAEKMGISQSAVAQMEKTDNPRSKTLDAAAAILGCEPEQLND